MSFQTGLSGLSAASRNLDVIGHNIANANTTGMKQSRTEFSALVAATLGMSGGSGGAGIGVEVAAVSQQFTQGNLSVTGNNLDVAINGRGFFKLEQPNGEFAYTRDGSFKLDKDGFLKTNANANVLGYKTDVAGVRTSATAGKLQFPPGGVMDAKVTTAIKAELNLDARSSPAGGLVAVPLPAPGVPAVPPTPRSTYATSVNVYDAQGVASPINLYFEKAGGTALPTVPANTWNVFGSLTGGSLGTLTFDNAGKLVGPTPTIATPGENQGKFGFTLTTAALTANQVRSNNPNDANGFLDGPFDLVLDGTTQFGSAFAVSNLAQDGHAAGNLVGISIGEDGLIAARYSNGQTQFNGQMELVNFRNVQGLLPQGGNTWSATPDSGTPIAGTPGKGTFGILRSGALEESNVELTAELVNMMTAQRAYQANAQTIKTQDQVMSTLVNLR